MKSLTLSLFLALAGISAHAESQVQNSIIDSRLIQVAIKGDAAIQLWKLLDAKTQSGNSKFGKGIECQQATHYDQYGFEKVEALCVITVDKSGVQTGQ